MQASDLSPLTSALEQWFLEAQRPLPWRTRYDPYEVWVSEVMLQQTRMEVVLPFFARFIRRFPSLEALAAADEQDVLAAWSGLGYYRRARMLHGGARDVVERFGGKVPATVEQLMSISGIGRYTAGAIASIAHQQKAPIVDGNVARVAARLFAIEEPVGSPALMRKAWLHEERMVEACTSPRAFNQGIMELGATICTPRKPKCSACPVEHLCAARRSGREESLPLAKVSVPPKRMQITLYLIRDEQGRVLLRREEGALMNAMYHLPHGDDTLLPGRAIDVSGARQVGRFRHTVTTRAIEFEVCEATLSSRVADDDAFVWLYPAELPSVPHPSYVVKALEAARIDRSV